MVTVPRPGTDTIRHRFQVGRRGKVWVGLDELFNLLNMVARHVLFIGEVVRLEV